MRKCYQKFYEPSLIEHMASSFPLFRYLDTAGRRKIGGLNYYGPGKLSGFLWNPVDSLIFIIIFRANKLDDFEASVQWSETGVIDKALQDTSEKLLFTEAVLNNPFALSYIQALSLAQGDEGESRVICWKFWKPEASIDDPASWYAEFIAEELRAIPDDEAKQRVDTAVSQAMIDIARCAMPWFEAKLRVYQQKAIRCATS